MYAVFVKGKIAAGRYDEAVSALRDGIVPMVKGAPGFVRGTWFGDHESGHGVMVFDSEESARAMATQVVPGRDAAISIDDPQVYEVHAEA